MTPEQAAKLREPFPPELIGKLPKVNCKACTDANKQRPGSTCDKHTKINCAVCGNWISERHIHLDYVGHAATTDRLLQADPEWTWEFVPDYPLNSNGLWIKLTIGGVSRYGFGDGKSPKEMIGDAIRNAAMRFGVALDLWAKEDLRPEENAETEKDVGARESSPAPEPGVSLPASNPAEPVSATFTPGQASLDSAQSRCKALAAAGIDILAARTEAHLPPLSRITDETQWLAWQILLDDLGVIADEKANA